LFDIPVEKLLVVDSVRKELKKVYRRVGTAKLKGMVEAEDLVIMLGRGTGSRRL